MLQLNSGSKFADARLLYDENNIQRRPNAALLLEEIKQEVESYDPEGFEGDYKMPGSSKRRTSIDAHISPRRSLGREDSYPGPPLTSIKQEDDVSVETGEEATFTMFASLLDSALQGSVNHLRTNFLEISSMHHSSKVTSNHSMFLIMNKYDLEQRCL